MHHIKTHASIPVPVPIVWEFCSRFSSITIFVGFDRKKSFWFKAIYFLIYKIYEYKKNTTPYRILEMSINLRFFWPKVGIWTIPLNFSFFMVSLLKLVKKKQLEACFCLVSQTKFQQQPKECLRNQRQWVLCFGIWAR